MTTKVFALLTEHRRDHRARRHAGHVIEHRVNRFAEKIFNSTQRVDRNESSETDESLSEEKTASSTHIAPHSAAVDRKESNAFAARRVNVVGKNETLVDDVDKTFVNHRFAMLLASKEKKIRNQTFLNEQLKERKRRILNELLS